MVTRLNEDLLNQALIVSGHHSTDTEMVGKLDADQRRVLGLLEAIDYGCFNYDTPTHDENGIDCLRLGNNTEKDVEHYLLQHKEIIGRLPMSPFVLGLLVGTFDFLYAEGATK